MKRGKHRQQPELRTVTSWVLPTAWPGSEGRVTEQSAEYSAEYSGSEKARFRGIAATRFLFLVFLPEVKSQCMEAQASGIYTLC